MPSVLSHNRTVYQGQSLFEECVTETQSFPLEGRIAGLIFTAALLCTTYSFIKYLLRASPIQHGGGP